MPQMSAPGFLPSSSGFHFANDWPANTDYPLVTLPVIGEIGAADAGRGICGGFVFAALDLFLHAPRMPPPADTHPPAGGTPLFDYIASRQVDSVTLNCLRYIEYIQAPDSDPDAGILGDSGLARRMVEIEWPSIKADIDSGRPAPLALVAPPRAGVLDLAGLGTALGNSHQVLAWRYDLDGAGNLVLSVYDCNDPANDGSQIAMNVADPTRPIAISAPRISAILGNEIRALFRSAYAQKDPIV